MLGKILDFICTRLCSTEIALDSLALVQYNFCRTKTRANKIPYFTKHCRITYNYNGIIGCDYAIGHINHSGPTSTCILLL